MTGSVFLAGVGVPDAPEGWLTLGCTVVDGAVSFANGALLLGRAGLVVDVGVDVDTDLTDLGSADLEGVPIERGPMLPSASHACGAFELDHLVLLTDSLERTSDAVHSVLGLALRRIREAGTVRQAFHRFDDPPAGGRGCIVEIVESDQVAATTLMGVVLNVSDLFELADELGPELVSQPKPAVQRGRYISTVRRDLGLGTAVALMTP